MRSTSRTKIAAARRAALTGEKHQQALTGLRAGGSLIPDAESSQQRQLEAGFLARIFSEDDDELHHLFAHITVRPLPDTLMLTVAPPAIGPLLFASLPFDPGRNQDLHGVSGLRVHSVGYRRWRLTNELLPGASIHLHGPMRIPAGPYPGFLHEPDSVRPLWTLPHLTAREADLAKNFPHVLFDDPAMATLLSRLLRRPKFWTIPPTSGYMNAWIDPGQVHVEWSSATDLIDMANLLAGSGLGDFDGQVRHNFRAVIDVTAPNATPAELHLRRNFAP